MRPRGLPNPENSRFLPPVEKDGIRLIRTIQGDFEATLRLEGGHVHSLSELNTAFPRWIAGT